MLRLIISGFNGKMGVEAVKMVTECSDFELVGGYAPHGKATDLAVPVFTDLATIPDHFADVWLDLSVPSAVFANAQAALQKGMRPLIGTTGLTPAQITELQALAQAQHLGGLIVPNFSVAAVLMIQLAQQAAQYLPDVEIIEMHNIKKVDAPSGTAKYTANKIKPDGNVPIHSVRLPGLVAHQEILFGGTGEMLTIRHDSFNRESFMPGVKLALQKISTLDQLVIGLENIL
ncbi:4-hydroxy-tetrahydrodipicolinate reductase [Periweissella ghanensis]|uniref:4-hydroxy-tetrahydrodipicolinate reductase n=1 Tax=Periweissella ghanensis TaxID=467997 RepID=A0ABM8ZEK2_9LACO|nr:4-hydroxy-tetrahydrodipicolinate reductase [Periweissella ghanensis]MCM0601288.1 4-hydroxy-tetrahydrodipicolinate reductase [Periweissella ghanensis]CAH0419342.1 4-hydroxy-tetrahydrodipicolinate reductase [Periweissella ghanensis]